MTRGAGGRRRAGSAGGVLLDLFLIAVLIAAGVVAWGVWRRGSFPAMFRDVSSLAPLVPGAPAPGPAAETEIDVSDRSARLQGGVRELLSRRGLKEEHVLRSYNVERREGGIQWLEDTLEVRCPPRFDVEAFLSALAPFLAEERLVLMEDKREGVRRAIVLGDRRRVYQRLVFESSR